MGILLTNYPQAPVFLLIIVVIALIDKFKSK